jgi:hypothetical protein
VVEVRSARTKFGHSTAGTAERLLEVSETLLGIQRWGILSLETASSRSSANASVSRSSTGNVQSAFEESRW